MKAILPAFVLSLSTLLPLASGQDVDPESDGAAWADVRLPLQELKAFLDASEKATTGPEHEHPPVAAAVLAARLSLDWQDSGPHMVMKLETENFTEAWQALPILDAGSSIGSVEPSGARVLVHQGNRCLLLPAMAKESLVLRQVLSADGNAYRFVPPQAGALSLEVISIPEGSVIGIQGSGDEISVERAGPVALPSTTGAWVIKKHARADIAKLTAPPQPSNWSWQQEIVAVPEDGELSCMAFVRIAAGQGSGVEAFAILPPEARSPGITGDDLDGPPIIARQEDGSQRVHLRWKSRDQLDRQFTIKYRLPVGPLDPAWVIPAPRAPAGQNLRVRFIIATDPAWSYDAEGLSAPMVAAAFPARIAEALVNRPGRIIDGAESIKIAVTPRAVAETSPSIVQEAIWQSRVEPDGAGLHEGTLVVEHRGAAACAMELPAGSRLLSCTLDGKDIKPQQSGDSGLEIPLAAGTETRRSRLTLAYTSRSDAFHPVEGTLPLTLPRGSDFIKALQWTIILPVGYQAETHGNLQRRETGKGDGRNVLRLEKNLCRDERPEITLFYQRADIAK